MNNRGQALVEFILVFPIMIFVVLGMIDFGNIVYHKYQLESELDLISELYNQDNQSEITKYSTEKGIDTSISTENNYVTITVTKNIKITTPGLNLVLGNPHSIETSRVLYEE